MRFKFGISHLAVAYAVAGVFGVLVVIDVRNEVTLDRRPPLSGLNLEPLNSPIHVGELLAVRAMREKVRDDCTPLTSVRSAINIVTGRKYYLETAVVPGGASGTDFVDLTFDTSGLPAGTYSGHAFASYPCPGLPPFEYQDNFFFTVDDVK